MGTSRGAKVSSFAYRWDSPTCDDAVLQLAGKRVGILFIHTPPDVAFEFYRGRGDGVSTIHDFLAIRDNAVERDVRELIGRSDAVLYNWTGRLSYRNIIGKLMADAARAGPGAGGCA